ncbi:MAG: monofunctional biosynthetic peptidoglycan transglycosylase [Synergistaceae bacterium]|nr:monofunctional biosynthetic peptidoglycan transglycosylase [Synergistaceae bacterium]MDD3845909.1 monofunctional biosynthetic peptidoglycan transglycosylase [Syntrophorhabdaceae bacterium]
MAKRRGKKKRPGKLLRFIKISIVLMLLLILGFAGFYMVYPDVSKLKKQNPGKTSFMEYREDEYRAKGKKIRIQSRWVPLKAISPYLMKAVLIAEDDKFWSHHGFDREAIQKAFEKNLESGKFKLGGSTISQQLTKNLYLTPAKNPVRKLKEAMITWRLERTLSKRRILEIYLNVVEWGEGVFGAEVASRRHFGKSAAALTAEEAAKLAAALPNPRRYRVDGTSRYVERRAKAIYAIMVRRGIVIPEYEEVVATQQEPTEGAVPTQPAERESANPVDPLSTPAPDGQ